MSEEFSPFIDGEPVAHPPAERRNVVPMRKSVVEHHRMLPSAPEAEQGIIGSLLVSPQSSGGACAEMSIAQDHFTDPARAQLYRVIMDMWENGRPIDLVTLTDRLRSLGILDNVGGSSEVAHLFTYLPTAANLGHYADIVIEKWTLRQIIQICNRQSERSYVDQDDVAGIMEQTERAIFEVCAKRHGRHSRRMRMKDLVMESISEIQDIYERRGAITGLSTGIASIDKATDGLHAQELIVLASRPSHGKTALAMQIAEFLSVDCKKPVGVFSLEMSARQLVQRTLCSRARVNMTRVRDGFLNERDFPALTASASKLAEAPIFMEEGSDMSIQTLRARARAMRAQHGIEALFVDSLSVIRSEGERDRHREVAMVSNGLKECAKELGIPVILIAHLGRAADGELRPKLSHLRESGNIEQDADAVWFLIRPELFESNDDKAAEMSGKAFMRVAKGRTGEMNFDVLLTYLKEFARFGERVPELDEPKPEKPKFAPYAGRRGKKTEDHKELL